MFCKHIATSIITLNKNDVKQNKSKIYIKYLFKNDDVKKYLRLITNLIRTPTVT